MKLFALALVASISVACLQDEVASEALLTHELQAGDCMNVPPGGDMGYVDVVPCDQGNDAEVFGVVELGDAGDPFPGEDRLLWWVDTDCSSALKSYLGPAWDDFEIDVTFISPSEDVWALGVRTAQCLLADPSGEQLEGSLKASGESD